MGDLHPFLALALALRERGFTTVIASAAEYRAKVEAAGIAFHAVRPSYDEVQRDLGIDRAELTRQTLAQGRFLFRKLLFSDLAANLRGHVDGDRHTPRIHWCSRALRSSCIKAVSAPSLKRCARQSSCVVVSSAP
jgi:hypothetical protein